MKRVLISVSDKSGLISFAKGLKKLGFEIIATEGTAKVLKKKNIPVKSVSEITGFREILGGKVKTLHPKIFGGILALGSERDLRKLEKEGIEPIDLVIVNLYPFEKVVERQDVEFAEAIENIDIGGPAMIRAAAKGALLHGRPVVVVDPSQYQLVIDELNRRDGSLSQDTIKGLAIKAFERTAEYDTLIKNYLRKVVK